jgi:uncharacterized protein
MDKSRLEVLPKVWLDYRRAVFLEEEQVLAVADLHLGYTWAQRFNGQMLPIHTEDPLLERLADLCSFYQPRAIALLGDIVHEAVPVSAVADDVRTLIEKLSLACEVHLVLGNHDKGLARIIHENDRVTLSRSRLSGKHLFLHGNVLPTERAADVFILMGHEHPAISLGDGVTSAKFPCFVVSDDVLILPAFSTWVAGTNIRAYDFMSPIARSARFQTAVAICGEKLLPVRL